MITLDDDVCIELGSRERPIEAIATLGPPGTSSEQAATALWDWLGGAASGPVIQLCSSYEAADEALRSGAVSHLLVANAYANINVMYMTPGIRLAAAFVLDTPMYGVAALEIDNIPLNPVIASHPAPVPLLKELLPAKFNIRQLVLTSSTSTAAEAARNKETDLALTTSIAAAANNLSFVSRTRPIRMLWSVFIRSEPEPFDESGNSLA